MAERETQGGAGSGGGGTGGAGAAGIEPTRSRRKRKAPKQYVPDDFRPDPKRPSHRRSEAAEGFRRMPEEGKEGHYISMFSGLGAGDSGFVRGTGGLWPPSVLAEASTSLLRASMRAVAAAVGEPSWSPVATASDARQVFGFSLDALKNPQLGVLTPP